MNDERFNRLIDVFAQAMRLPREQRRRYVEVTLAQDQELLQEALKMVSVDLPEGWLEPSRPAGAPAEVAGKNLEGMVLGPFRLLHEIGRGGMGVVYEAEQADLGRRVAVKILPFVPGASDPRVERFRRESRSLSTLDHPHIVPILERGEALGLAWYAMRFVAGHDLHAELQRQIQAQGRDRAAGGMLLPPFGGSDYVGTVVARIAELADALQHAHEHGIVHRDVKPRNILLDSRARMHLVDFGLAKDLSLEGLTRSGQVQGTPHYMSPEQARAQRDRIDHRTDVYSLSVVLYELLCLERPYGGETPEEVLRHVIEGSSAPLRRRNPRIPRELALVCEKGMAPDRQQRYSTAAELASDLRRFLQHESVLARAPSLAYRARNAVRRHPGASTALAALVLLLPLALLLARFAQRKAQLANWSGRIRAALAVEDWSGSEATVADARRASAELRSAGLARAAGEVIGALEQRLESERSVRLEAIRRSLSLGIGGQPGVDGFGEHLSDGSDQDLFEGLDAAGRAATIWWDDPEVLQLAEVDAVFPRVAVRLDDASRSGTAGGRVLARRVDHLSGDVGAPRELGPLPLPPTPLPPGDYRFVVEVDGVGFAEIDRELWRSPDPIELVVRVRETEQVLEGMVEIPAGRLKLVRTSPLGCNQMRDEVALEAFAIDATEVSNRDYLEYLAATGAEPPPFWTAAGYVDDWRQLPVEGFETAWLELPVVGLSFEGARAYAEWAGKRLPTHFELERALRGPDGWRTPWDGGEDGAGLANVEGPQLSNFGKQEADGYRLYLGRVLPVAESGYGQAPTGLFHGFGNVAEWTSSKLVEQQDGRLVVDRWKRIVMGHAWDALARKQDLSDHPYWGVGESHASINVGLRCARSLETRPQ